MNLVTWKAKRLCYLFQLHDMRNIDRGFMNFVSSTAANSIHSTITRVFQIGIPSLSSTASVASSSVCVIFEEVIEENVMNAMSTTIAMTTWMKKW